MNNINDDIEDIASIQRSLYNGILPEDVVRDAIAKPILNFDLKDNTVYSGTGQITTFNQLSFEKITKKPDGWYLPKNPNEVAIILETKSDQQNLSNKKWVDELFENCNIVMKKYKKVVGILYNYDSIRVFKNNIEVMDAAKTLQPKEYYLSMFDVACIDKQRIYTLTSKINNNLHKQFGIKNLYHRMIFTACALVAQRYGAELQNIMNIGYAPFHSRIYDILSKSLESDTNQNNKLKLLLDVYNEIKMNNTENQAAINEFIECVCEISSLVNSNNWNGEDVMAIFFNEFNRYKAKSENGQVFTPDHITSLMYRLIDVTPDDYVLDAACGSGAFLVKSMCNMIKAVGGMNTQEAARIKSTQLYGIEFDREIYALACANMLIHKDGKTNLEQMDTTTEQAKEWIKGKTKGHSVKVLMNPPFERAYGCKKIVKNVLDSVPTHTLCAFILPDRKLEKEKCFSFLKEHRLLKIIKLPENIFKEGVTTSIFIFETGVPQNNRDVFACYIKDDGLETVKNQGRQDTKNRWNEIEDKWVDVIAKQSGDDSCVWIKPDASHLSYPIPKKECEISEADFEKTMLDYLMYEEGISLKEFNDAILESVIYGSKISQQSNGINIFIEGSAD